MRIAYISRLFTGLETTVASCSWMPAGVPTIFKMIEGLQRSGHDLHLVLACKDGGSGWTSSRDATVQIAGLANPVKILAGAQHLQSRLGGIAGWWRELRQLLAILRHVRSIAPDLVYLDHANLWAGAVLARFSRRPVVFRVMGVYPVMRRALDGGRLAFALMRWCYRSPWTLVVCSEDGSGSEPWLRRALRPGVPWRLMVNGVDPASTQPGLPPYEVPPGKVIVLFLGKLETAKGAMEFTEGFLAARRQRADLHAVVVGEGSLSKALRSRVADAGADAAFTFLGRVPHRDVTAILASSDIYVSLNRLGNLSNANLEAMRAGIATVIPAAQPELGIDVATDAFLGPNAALRIPCTDDREALAAAIVHLAASPETRRQYGDAIARSVDRFAGDWPTRIAREIALLEEIHAGRRPAAEGGTAAQ